MLKISKNYTELPQLSYELNPEFGRVHIPVVCWCDLNKSSGMPSSINIDLANSFKISPFNSTLHYGQSIFEGLKVYRLDDGNVGIFRPDKHMARLVNSAKMMSMAPLDIEFLMECLKTYVAECKVYVPSEPGHSLYLRPLYLGTDNLIKVKSCEHYSFLLMSSIVGQYFKSNSSKMSKVLVNKTFMRAFPGGTGEAKTSSNYALSLPGLEYAQSLGYDQVLYLDAINKTNFEELGGMNFFIVKNNKLITPKLNGQILHGVTRDSLLEIAAFMGYETEVRDFSLNELIEGQKDGSIKEVFASGTAASIAPLGEIGIQDTKGGDITTLEFPNTEVGTKLREYLVNTHYGRTEHSKKWLEII